jgi:hypothetical protein
MRLDKVSNDARRERLFKLLATKKMKNIPSSQDNV